MDEAVSVTCLCKCENKTRTRDEVRTSLCSDVVSHWY